MAATPHKRICVVGRGVSAVAAQRAFSRVYAAMGAARPDIEFIAEDGSVWDKMSQTDDLDFELVSAGHETFLAHDILRECVDGVTPTRKGYARALQRICSELANVRQGCVERVEVSPRGVVLHLSDGECLAYDAVVLATNFDRGVNSMFGNGGPPSTGSILCPHIGDSANLVVQRAVARGQRVVVLSNGFAIALKELTLCGSEIGTADVQFDRLFSAPALRAFGKWLTTWAYGYATPFRFNHMLQSPIMPRDKGYSNWVSGSGKEGPAALHDGTPVLKYQDPALYWKRYGSNLEGAVRQGLLFSDINFMASMRDVEVVAKRDVMLLGHTLVYGEGFEETFDYVVPSSREVVRQPCISISGAQYVYSFDTLLRGVSVMATGNRLHFLGHVRPQFGGIGLLLDSSADYVAWRCAGGREPAELQRRWLTDYNYARLGLPNTATSHVAHVVRTSRYVRGTVDAVWGESRVSDPPGLLLKVYWAAVADTYWKLRAFGPSRDTALEQTFRRMAANHQYGFPLILWMCAVAINNGFLHCLFVALFVSGFPLPFLLAAGALVVWVGGFSRATGLFRYYVTREGSPLFPSTWSTMAAYAFGPLLVCCGCLVGLPTVPGALGVVVGLTVMRVRTHIGVMHPLISNPLSRSAADIRMYKKYKEICGRVYPVVR